MMEWLLAPIDAARPPDITLTAAWHARFMMLAWGVFIPAGVVIARYGKVMPWQDWPRELDNRVWWRSHLWLQQSGAVLTVLAIGLALTNGRQEDGGLHVWFGWAVIGALALQLASGWLRGSKGGPSDIQMWGDHYVMTRRRRIFEAFHKSLGWTLLGMAAITIVLGLWSVNAPRWMWAALALYWFMLAGVSVICERHALAIGSYRAIWGPDPQHPGNRPQ